MIQKIISNSISVVKRSELNSLHPLFTFNFLEFLFNGNQIFSEACFFLQFSVKRSKTSVFK